MPRYTEEHYEDVARLLDTYCGVTVRLIAQDFADLFAADNPRVCEVGSNHGPDDICGPACLRGGFNHAAFLRACGIEAPHYHIGQPGDRQFEGEAKDCPFCRIEP